MIPFNLIIKISKKELNLPKGGPSYNSETDKRIDDEGARASKIILCQKRGRSPIFVGWWVTVFYDSNDRVQQIASLNKLIF